MITTRTSRCQLSTRVGLLLAVFIEHLKKTLKTPLSIANVSLEIKVAKDLIHYSKKTNNVEEVFKRLNIVLDEAQFIRHFFWPFNLNLEYASQDVYLSLLNKPVLLKVSLTGSSI